MQKEFSINVRGRVQMVMYRDFAQRKARALGVVGSVQNLKDGSVHIVAQGEEDILQKYIELLKKGSKLSKVENLEIEECKELGKYAIFNIIF